MKADRKRRLRKAKRAAEDEEKRREEKEQRGHKRRRATKKISGCVMSAAALCFGLLRFGVEQATQPNLHLFREPGEGLKLTLLDRGEGVEVM